MDNIAIDVFKKGDIVVWRTNPEVKREIVKARKGSYLWKYPDLPDGENNIFDSRNSNDPKLTYWKKYNLDLTNAQ